MTTIRVVEPDGHVTDVRFVTKWAARLACRQLTEGFNPCRAAFVVASDEEPCKATGKVQR